MGRPIILAVVTDLMGGNYFLVPMLLDTGADETCFPCSHAGYFGHDNNHRDVAKDIVCGIGGNSACYIHSVQVSLIDPKRSTKKKPSIAWTSKNKTAGFVENLKCEFGIIGMDTISQWRFLSFEPNRAGLMIRISV
jgi:hypothetical protein